MARPHFRTEKPGVQRDRLAHSEALQIELEKGRERALKTPEARGDKGLLHSGNV